MTLRTFDGVLHGIGAMPVLGAIVVVFLFGIRPHQELRSRIDSVRERLKLELDGVRAVGHRTVTLREELADVERGLEARRRQASRGLATPEQLLEALVSNDGERCRLSDFRNVEPTAVAGYVTSSLRIEGGTEACVEAVDRIAGLEGEPIIRSAEFERTGDGKIAVELMILTRELPSREGEP
mgnify:FL=1